MSTFLSFIADSKVHDSVLGTMIVTSFLAAVRRFKTVDNTPIAPGFNSKIKLLWNFFYDWLTGFWSMKSGHGVPTNEVHIQTSEQTPDSTKIQDATFTSAPIPTQPVAIPAQPTK